MDKSLYVVFMYLITHIGLIFFMYPGDIIASTDQAHWIPILVGVCIHLIMIFLYLSGLSRFPRQDIISIYSAAGKVIAIIFLFPVSLYFLAAIILSVRAYSEIINIVFLSNTPLWAVMAFILFFSSFLAFQGLEAIFRTGFLLTMLFLPLLLFVFCVSFQNVDWHYIYPLWNNNFSFLTNSSYLKSYFAIGGSFIFVGFVEPFFSYQKKKVMLAALILIPFFLISVYVPILTFGQATASTLLFPFVTAVDGVVLNWLMFDRITMFFLLSIITFIMLFISLVLWKFVRIVHAALPGVKTSYLFVVSSIFIYFICLLIPTWYDVERLFLWNTFLRFYVMLFVPLSIFILGLKASKREDANNA